MIEWVCTDGGDAVGDGDGGQAITKGKRTVADGGDAARDGDVSKTDAAVKRPVADGGDGISIQFTGDFQRFRLTMILRDLRCAIVKQGIFIIFASKRLPVPLLRLLQPGRTRRAGTAG